jgi:hypothetical protein
VPLCLVSDGASCFIGIQVDFCERKKTCKVKKVISAPTVQKGDSGTNSPKKVILAPTVQKGDFGTNSPKKVILAPTVPKR